MDCGMKLALPTPVALGPKPLCYAQMCEAASHPMLTPKDSALCCVYLIRAA
jgi:hypothetical protein